MLNKHKTGFTLLLDGDLVKEKTGDGGIAEQLQPLYNLSDLVEKYPQGNLQLMSGDRDWNNNKKGGEKSVDYLQSQIENYANGKGHKRTKWLVGDACPGPEGHEVNDGLIIIGLNSQWWNHRFDKPPPLSGGWGGVLLVVRDRCR